jgi:hypothetical protein
VIPQCSPDCALLCRNGCSHGLMLYLLGKSVHSQTAGLLAAGSLAVSFCTGDSYYAVPDSAVTLCHACHNLAAVGIGSPSDDTFIRRHRSRLCWSTNGRPPCWCGNSMASLWVGAKPTKASSASLIRRLGFTCFLRQDLPRSPQILVNRHLHHEAVMLSELASGGFVPWQQILCRVGCSMEKHLS